MNVTIAVNGKFHAFEMASELYKRGMLDKLITTYPYSKVKNYCIPKSKVVSLVYLEFLKRFITVLPLSSRYLAYLNYLEKILFDLNCSLFLSKKSTHFIGWASNVMFSMLMAKRLGLTTVLERGSTHIVHQKELLMEEYSRWNLTPNLPIDFIVKRELKEYSMADYIFIPSHHVRDTFIDHNIKECSLKIIQYGIMKSFYLKPLNKLGDPLSLLFVGQLSIRKGGLYLLQAIHKLIRSNNSNFEFHHYGAIESALKPFIPTLHPGCYFHGPTNQAKLPEIFARSSLFLFPSLEEGLALVLLQAAAAGLPIAATKSSGVLELVDNGASVHIIQERSTQSIIDCITHFKKNRHLLASMSSSSTIASKSFTMRAYGERISSTLLSCSKAS